MENMNNNYWEIFHDEVMNGQFNRDGFIVLDFNPVPVIDALLELFGPVAGYYHHSYQATVLLNDLAHRKLMHEKIRDIAADIFLPYLKSYRSIYYGFSIKNAQSTDNGLQLHQDLTSADPGGRPSLGLWCPLVPVDLHNGCLQVVPGSHINNYPRALFSHYIPQMDEQELCDHVLTLPMEPGQLLLFNQGLVHASPANQSNAIRPAITSVILPEESPVFFFYRNEETDPVTIDGYIVEEDFYLYHNLIDKPEHGQLVASMEEKLPFYQSFSQKS